MVQEVHSPVHILAHVTRQELERFRDGLAVDLSPKTIQHQIKGLRIMFRSARKDFGIENPAEFVKAGESRRKKNNVRKSAFSVEDLRVLVAHMTGEWKTLTLLGACTGARLADLQFLKWDCVDIPRRMLRFVTRKTGRDMKVPIAPVLLRRLQGLTEENSTGFVLPGLAGKKTNSLSGEFTDFLRQCGLRHDEGKTEGPRRNVALSFHSLRHGVVSMLKDAGASASVAMEFAGHDSAEMSSHYTQVSDASMRTAADSLPDLEAPAISGGKP